MNLLNNYRPNSLQEIVGQGKNIQIALNFVNNFQSGRAMLFHGLPGVGKNLIIENIAKENSLDLLRLAASDERGAEDIEQFAQTTQTKSLFNKGKIILIDDVDGISGNDRGAVSAIVNLIKNSRYPVFLTANDPWQPKLLPFRSVCEFVKFGKVNSISIEKKLKEICEKEMKEINPDVIKQVALSSNGDVRAAINDLELLFIGDQDTIGYREREKSIFDILPLIFNSQNIDVTRQAIFSSDKDPDDVMWWVENNIHLIFQSPEEIANAFDLISRADIFRGRVSLQQNWRFKAYMTDIIASVSLMKNQRKGGFIPYQSPKKFAEMAASRKNRALLMAVCEKIGGLTHSSNRAVKRDYLPYMRIVLKKNKKEYFGLLTEEDVRIIKTG